MHCQNFLSRPTNRRDMLKWCANGFGAVALSALSAQGRSPSLNNPLTPEAHPFSSQGKECHLSLHGRSSLTGGYL